MSIEHPIRDPDDDRLHNRSGAGNEFCEKPEKPEKPEESDSDNGWRRGERRATEEADCDGVECQPHRDDERQGAGDAVEDDELTTL